MRDEGEKKFSHENSLGSFANMAGYKTRKLIVKARVGWENKTLPHSRILTLPKAELSRKFMGSSITGNVKENLVIGRQVVGKSELDL